MLSAASNTRSTALPVGELFILGFRGLSLPGWLRSFALRFGLGGVILFDVDLRSGSKTRNIVSPEQLRLLCAEISALPSRPWVFLDQEGGSVCRLSVERGFAPLPAPAEFARLSYYARTRLALRSYAELHALGVDYNLAPVLDLNLDPHNAELAPRGRSYSAHPRIVRENAALLRSVAAHCGVGLCFKHYPGLGAAKVDSHHEGCLIPTPSRAQLLLYHRFSRETPAAALLVAHINVEAWDAERPASLSPLVLRRLRKAAPDVLLVADDLQMGSVQRIMDTSTACVQGIAAGLDLLLIGQNLRAEEAQSLDFAKRVLYTAQTQTRFAERVQKALARVQCRKASWQTYRQGLRRARFQGDWNHGPSTRIVEPL